MSILEKFIPIFTIFTITKFKKRSKSKIVLTTRVAISLISVTLRINPSLTNEFEKNPD